MLRNMLVSLAKSLVVCGALISTSVVAQPTYPTKPIRLIVPWGPGGGADIMGRLVGRWLETDLKGTVVVLNQPGATGSIGLRKLVEEGGDGHTLGVLTGDTLTLGAFPEQLFNISNTVTLGIMIRQPSGLFTRFDGPYKTWDDVIAAAKAKPGTINVAITGPNSPDELTIKYLETKGLKMVTVPYAKPGERFVAAIAGHVELLYEQAGDVKAHLDGKKLRPLIFFDNKRAAEPFANVPVSSEYGYDVLLPQTRSILAKKGVDQRIVDRISDSLNRYSKTPEFANYLRDQYAAPDSFVGAKDAQKFLENEVQSFKKILETVNKK
jgi:tripartite-type tricarboxylate transporter receptor subunit TctC